MDKSLEHVLSLLQKYNISNKTIIIFTADHGEEFKEHGRFLHSQLYNEIIHVPLIVYNPQWLIQLAKTR